MRNQTRCSAVLRGKGTSSGDHSERTLMTYQPALGRRLMRAAICGLLAAIVLLPVGTAAGGALQGATVDTTKDVFFTAPSPCTGEEMAGVANLHDVIAVNPDGTIHFTETIQGIKAVGLVTQLSYVGSEE